VEPLTITLESDEVCGLAALVEIDRIAHGGVADADPVSTARALIQSGLTTRLNELDLSWAPSAEAVAARAAKAKDAYAASPKALRALARDERVRRYGGSVVLTAALVALLGGYIGRWHWTGFQANNQVWDWLNLLLLPVVIGTVPIWLLHAERMSRARRVTYGVFVLAFAGFVTAGYLIPLNWTGFRGNTLWNWFVLIVLPVTIVVSGVWPKSGRTLRRHHKAAITVLVLGWIVSLVGGYVWTWAWTGYQGNTLWDWLQLLLLPLVFPTIVLPAALRWVSGNAAALTEGSQPAAKGTVRTA
jgi:hypothetical protein